MGHADIVSALEPVVAVLDELAVPYAIGGSVASSACGVPRTTLDVDVVAALQPEHVRPFTERLRDRYYLDADAMTEAITRQASFNLVHLETMLKVDVFVLKKRAYDQAAFQRRRPDRLGPPPAGAFYFAAPEDVILNKLEWFRLGGETSERQWHDVIGVLKIQGTALDASYMHRWAANLAIADLLERAVAEASKDD